ncbi:hypothetical protein HMPREF2651_02625 [Corynebacterium sp. HMSC063A05]|nr:hypothetical protein HMPREF2651_02625 [Corynebacterium sp. HMSC063A05]OFN06523.1 hypothetical protein HMPREF2614_02305 [Corynebacterium sp. HMSC074C11]OFR92176.1 hypothetical protein HMPREF2860_04090 [Corynebacterium sp. HMSC064E10]
MAPVIGAGTIILWPCHNVRGPRHDFLVAPRTAINLIGLASADVTHRKVHVLPTGRPGFSASVLKRTAKCGQAAAILALVITPAALITPLIAAPLVVSPRHD